MKKNNATATADRVKAIKAGLKRRQVKLEFIADLIDTAESNRRLYMRRNVVKDSYREEYTDSETGKLKTRYVWEEYERDENGDIKYFEPTEENESDYIRYSVWSEIIEDLILLVK